MNNQQTFTSADDFAYSEGESAAAEYVAKRCVDAAKLMSEMTWSAHSEGVMECRLYGHSILWDIRGDRLHAFHTNYEVMWRKADDIDLYATLQQVVACILMKNW